MTVYYSFMPQYGCYGYDTPLVLSSHGWLVHFNRETFREYLKLQFDRWHGIIIFLGVWDGGEWPLGG